MDIKKKKITSKKELEYRLELMVFDDWISEPIFKTIDEMKQYNETVRRKKIEILEKKYDICIEDD